MLCKIKQKSQTTIKAFTLAEVLITLGIIGVVAAITIPALINNSEKKELKTAWKKNASVITNAYLAVKAENGGSVNEFFPNVANGSAAMKNELIKHLNVIKDCSATSGIICETSAFANINTYKTLGLRSLTYIEYNSGSVILKDGTTVFFRNYSPDALSIFVDVNGVLKGPNVLGIDFFGLTATKDWIKPFGSDGSVKCNCSESPINHTCLQAGWACEATLYCEGAACSVKYLIE